MVVIFWKKIDKTKENMRQKMMNSLVELLWTDAFSKDIFGIPIK